jgi:hypothetical protein
MSCCQDILRESPKYFVLTPILFSGTIAAMGTRQEMDMLTIQDAAREAGTTEDAVRKAILRGRLPVVLKYGRKLITRAAFETYRQGAQRGRPRKQSTAEETH